jgi:hypothetical protein
MMNRLPGSSTGFPSTERLSPGHDTQVPGRRTRRWLMRTRPARIHSWAVLRLAMPNLDNRRSTVTRLLSPASDGPGEGFGLDGEADRPDRLGSEMGGGFVRGCSVELTGLLGGSEAYAWRDAGSWHDSTPLSHEREAASGKPCFKLPSRCQIEMRPKATRLCCRRLGLAYKNISVGRCLCAMLEFALPHV